VIAWPVIGVEAMIRIVNEDLAGMAGGLERLPHLLDAFERNAAVFCSIEAKNRGLQVGDNIDGVLGLQFRRGTGQATIPGGRGL